MHHGRHHHKGIDRRADARHGAAPPVTVTAPDGTRLQGDAANLSLGGLFIACPPESAAPLPVGTDCRVRLTFRDGSRRVNVDLMGRVAHADDGGLGIAFTYLDADNHARLNEALSSGLAAAPEG